MHAYTAPKATNTVGYSRLKVTVVVPACEVQQSRRHRTIMTCQNTKRKQHTKPSMLLTFTLIVMISCFVFATPLSLILTIPAYVLADKVSVTLARKLQLHAMGLHARFPKHPEALILHAQIMKTVKPYTQLSKYSKLATA